MIGPAHILSLAWAVAVPTEVQYVGNPNAVQVVERGAAERYVTLTKQAPLRAEVTGPGTLRIEVRAPLKRSQKKAKRVSLRALLDTVESGRFPLELRQAPRASKAQFRGPGTPRGKVPSASYVTSLPIEAGAYFLELQIDGAEPLLFVSLRVEETTVESTPQPTGDDSLAALPALPGLPEVPNDSGVAPLPLPSDDAVVPSAGTPIAAEEPAATPAPDAASWVSYAGSAPQVTIEEMGDSKVYREVASDKPLRAEVTGPGTLMVGVRGALGKGAPSALVLHVDVDGTERGAFPVQLEPTPPSAATRFVEGGRAGERPSAEAWFTLEMAAGAAFCTVTLEPEGALAYVALELTPSSVDVAVPEKDPSLLSREELERLQELSASAEHGAQDVGASWRLALEVAAGGFTPLVEGEIGYGARVGLQLTAPWLRGVLGVSLSGALQQASGVATGIVGGPTASLFEISRRRRLVPLEAGLHLLIRPTRRLRLIAEGGGGQYWLEMTRNVLGRERTLYRASRGGWGALRLGLAFEGGMLFVGGRGYGAGAVSSLGGTT
ncbi:MAG: hypothetical protein AAB426_12165, partial [Myxococcota bacterium]